MPAEPVIAAQPQHPVYALTTYELRSYQSDLENALATLPDNAPARTLIQQQLSEVHAEQADRRRIGRATSQDPAR